MPAYALPARAFKKFSKQLGETNDCGTFQGQTMFGIGHTFLTMLSFLVLLVSDMEIFKQLKYTNHTH